MTTTENTANLENTNNLEKTIEVANTHEETSSEIKTESTLFAEPIFHIGNFTVTNSLFTSWIVVILLIALAITIRIKLKQIPKGIQNFFEYIIEGAESLCDQVTNSRKITNKAFPIVFTIFLIVLLNNWIGILPFGGFGLVEVGEHGKVFIPFIRS